MSRAFAYVIHFGLGLVWLFALYELVREAGSGTAAAIWVVFAFVLWLVDAARMADAPDPWRITFLWWLGSFVAPFVALWRGYEAFAGAPEHGAEVEEDIETVSDHELRRRLSVAESTLAALTREVAELRRLLEGRAPATPEPAPRPAPAAERPPAPPREPLIPPPPPVPPAPRVPDAPPAPPVRPEPVVAAVARPAEHAEPEERETSFWDHDVTLADLVGPKAFAIAGGVVTLLGVVFFFVLAANRGWIGPELRVALGAAASIGVFAGGFWLRRRDPESYSSLAAVGAGLAGGYVTLAAATVLYGLLPSALALPFAAGLAAAGVTVAIAWSAQLVAALGLIGAIAAPALLALDEGISATGTAFVAIMFGAAVVVGVRQVWSELLLASAAAAVPQALWLALAADGLDWGAVVVCAVFAGLLLGAGVAYELRENLPYRISGVGYVLASATLAGICSRLLFDSGGDLGTALLVIALAYAAVAIGLFVRGGLVDLSSLVGALALTFGAVAGAELLSGQSLAIAWALQAAVLAWLARAIDEPRYQLGALAYLGLSLVHVLAIDAPLTDLFTARQHPGAGMPSVAALAAAQAVVAWFASPWESEPRVRRLAAVDGAVRGSQQAIRLAAGFAVALLGVYAASLGILEVAQLSASADAGEIRAAFEWGHVAVTTIAALIAFAAFLLANRFAAETVRAAVTVGLAIVLIKDVVFDIGTLQESRSGWSALVLGVVIFAVSVLALHLLPRESELNPVSWVGAVIAAGLGSYAALALLSGAWAGVDAEGAGLLAVALPYAVVGAFELRRLREFASLLLAIALIVAGVASTFLLAGAWLVLAWAIAAAALAGLTLVVGETRFLAGSHAYAVIALGYTLSLGDDAAWAALALGAGLFVTGVLVQHTSVISRAFDPIAVAEAIASALLGAYAVLTLLDGDTWAGWDARGVGVLGLAAPFLVAGAAELAARRDYAGVHLTLGLAAVGAAAALLLDGTWLVLAFAALATGLAGLTVVSRESRFLVASHVFAALAIGHVLAFEAPPTDLFVADRNPGNGAPAALLAALAILVAALVAGREDRYISTDERPLPAALRDSLSTIRELGLWITGALAVFSLSLTLLQLMQWISPASVDTDFQRGHVAVSASWAIIGLLLLYVGLRYELTRLRLAGIVLFGISLVKLFIYDLAFLSPITRAFSFLAVGVLMLLAGFFYQQLVRPRDTGPA